MDPKQPGRELRRLISSLDDARGRREAGAWKAEGVKCVGDLLGHFRCRILVATHSWLDDHAAEVTASGAATILGVSPHDMERMSRLQSPPPVIGVFDLPSRSLPTVGDDSLIIALDTIQDPGNLGTIIRTADWMGVRDIVATRSTADCFGPKVVMATMGALARVRVHYVDSLAHDLAERRRAGMRVIGTFLDGSPLYDAEFPAHGDGCVLLMGNEGRGVSEECASTVTDRILIPPYPAGATTSESLNVATATAIMLAHLRFASAR